MDLFEKIKSISGYTFRKPGLLEEAITHTSSPNKVISYERLEFLGDSVLSLVFTKHFFSIYPNLGSGELTELRSANLCNKRLARVAMRHELYEFMKIDNKRFDKEVRDFKDATSGEADGEIYGGAIIAAPKFLADVIESLAGAIFKDSGHNISRTWQAVRKLLSPIITIENLTKQPVEGLRQLAQENNTAVEYRGIMEGNMAHVEAVVGGQVVGEGKSPKWKVAKRIAASQAFHNVTGDMSSVLIHPEGGAKEELDKICKKENWPSPTSKITATGPAYKKSYSCTVCVKTTDQKVSVTGKTRSKVEDAEHAAAFNILPRVKPFMQVDPPEGPKPKTQPE